MCLVTGRRRRRRSSGIRLYENKEKKTFITDTADAPREGSTGIGNKLYSSGDLEGIGVNSRQQTQKRVRKGMKCNNNNNIKTREYEKAENQMGA